MTKQAESRVVKEDDIDLRELAGLLLDRKWLIIGVTLAFFTLGILYSLLAAPVYQAQALVQVESKIPSIPGISDLASVTGASASASSTEVALLTSRTVVGAAVDQLGLSIDAQPVRFPVIGGYFARKYDGSLAGEPAPAKFGLNSYGWGGESIRIHALEVPEKELGKPLGLVAGDTKGTFVLFDFSGDEVLRGHVGKTAEGRGYKIDVVSLTANPQTKFELVKYRKFDVVSALQKDVAVLEQGRESGILQLSYESTDPLRAEDLVRSVSEAYVRQNVDRSSAEAASQLQFVREQLPVVRAQVERAQAAMTEFQSKANSVDITMQTKGLLDQEVAVEASIQQLRLKQAEMDRSYTREHPAYRALLNQLRDLEARKVGFQRQVGQLPDTQQELLRLTRDLQVGNEMYTALLNQAQQLDVARAGAVGNVRVVDPAAVDIANPVKPRKAIIVAGLTLLGAFLAVGFVLVQRMLNPGIEDPADIEALGLPVYAAIPLSVSSVLPKLRQGRNGTRIIADGRQHLLALAAPAEPSVEALRSLRTSLHFAMIEAKNNILAISGPRPGVGKTFVSSNLAAVIAQAGQRVLLIDADMRKGTLHKLLGVSPKGGLSDILAGTAVVDSVIHSVPGLDGMHYIVRGDIPPNPAELLMHPRFAGMLESLSSNYDLIIIDTPPILAVTDAALVATHAGSSLLVTRFGVNQVKEIELTLQRFEQNGVSIKGAIFNAVEKRSTGYYSYGYYEYTSDKS